MMDNVIIYAPLASFVIWVIQRAWLKRRVTTDGALTSLWPERFSFFTMALLGIWVLATLIFSDLKFTDLLIVFTFFLLLVMITSRLVWGRGVASYKNKPLFLDAFAGDYGPALFVIMALRSFVIEPFNIPSSSMVPTLQVGDFIVVNKFKYGLRLPIVHTMILPMSDPERGDVVVFTPPHEDSSYIKRIIGIPGDLIEYREKILYINNRPALYEPVETVDSDLSGGGEAHVYKERLQTGTYKIQNSDVGKVVDGTWTVPAGQYFVMGDNRDNSGDSREWGFVDKSAIAGKAFYRWMHYSNDKGLLLDRGGWI
jgi:signal peptidase I